MPHVSPLPRNAVPELAELFDSVEKNMGFLPNSMQTMARIPGLVPALLGLTGVVLSAQGVPASLKSMVSYMVSRSQGCLYCQAHTCGSTTRHHEISEEKFRDIWTFETSLHFSAAERAALRVAMGAGQSPSAVTSAEMDDLKSHFSDDQVAEIVAVISLFGFYNRWNDTMATTLEDESLQHAKSALSSDGWCVGKHKADHSD